MKRLNRKGFTLIELLAVIVILGVLLMIAIPSMNTVIENSKKDSFASNVKQMIESVRYSIIQEEYTLPGAGEATVVAQEAIETVTGGAQSAFNRGWNTAKSYIVVVSVEEKGRTVAKYYAASVDTQRNGFNITYEDNINRSAVLIRSTQLNNVPEITGAGSTITVDGNSYRVTEYIDKDGNISNA